MMLDEKVQKSIDALKLASEMSENYYHKPLIVTYSGGKDSEVLVDLAMKSGIKFEVHNHHTTVDAPETVYHVRKQFKKWKEQGIPCIVDYPKFKGERTSMWKLILDEGILPSPWARYCCKVLKESGDPRRFIATGVRTSESPKRSGRQAFEWLASQKFNQIKKSYEEAAEVYQEALDDSPYGECRFIKAARQRRNLAVNPIIDWTDDDVWDYIHANNLSYNPLYDEGFKRVGCVGCPLANYKKRKAVFERFPRYEKLYRKSCQKLLDYTLSKGKNFYLDKDKKIPAKNGDEIFEWWLHIRP